MVTPSVCRRVRWLLVWACVLLPVEMLIPWPAEAAFPRVLVRDVWFDTALQHNVPDLIVVQGTQMHEAFFLRHFRETGDVDRWGHATSEVVEEEVGSLVQYFQRGVLEWHAHPSCGTPTGYCIQRKLAWDYFGGGRGGSTDFGVEPGLFNPNPGIVLGPWGHRVANRSIEGVEIGFEALVQRFGGVDKFVDGFGFPKTDARYDDRPDAKLRSGDQGHRVRQYFQAAVVEFEPRNPPPYNVQLSLLGDDLRDRTYPNNAWMAFRSFRPSLMLATQASYNVERVIPGPRVLQAYAAGYPVTELCSASDWKFGSEPFCETASAFARRVEGGAEVLTGDAVRSRNASPDLVVGSLVDRFEDAVLHTTSGFLTLATDAVVWIGSAEPGAVVATIVQGEVGVLDSRAGSVYENGDGTPLTTEGTIFLVAVRKDASGATLTTVKVMEGRVRVGPGSRMPPGTVASVNAGEQITLNSRGGALQVVPRAPLTSGEQERYNALVSLKAALGKPVAGPADLRRLLPPPVGSNVVPATPAPPR
jgi:hypothetical protein